MYNKHMYQLMNKDNIIALFDRQQGPLGDSYVMRQVLHPLPIGFQNVEAWLENRKASKHNRHLRLLMEQLGCSKTEGFIRLTHAASINDTFWVREEAEEITWDRVSLFANPFSDVVSKLAFEGIGLFGGEFSSMSPELTTDGSYRKCFTREQGRLFIYKRGLQFDEVDGLEPYCECMASEVADAMHAGAVHYELTAIHGAVASKCEVFTNEEVGYSSFAKTSGGNAQDANAALAFYAGIGSEDAYSRMLVLDALIFNGDRHPGNHGILFQNDSLEPVSMAPVFDLNLALFPYKSRAEFDDPASMLRDTVPKIGDDFTRLAQLALTPQISDDVRPLCDFSFSFRGDDRFPAWRVEKLERLVRRQAGLIVSEHEHYTREVFDRI